MTDTVRAMLAKMLNYEGVEMKCYQDVKTLKIVKWRIGGVAVAKSSYDELEALTRDAVVENSYTVTGRKNHIHIYTRRIRKG